jgi:hypothetical protein|tara:strand:+ start:7129 stop:7476 length:348 start_codon:yes stop_codon:yes gene_type:complete
MPRVIFRRTWFAPTEHVKVDRLRTMAGRRYRRGEHDIPEEFMEFLPSDAQVLDAETPAAPEVEDDEETLADYDEERAAAEAIPEPDEIEAKRAAFKAELEAEEAPKKRGRPRKGS